MVSEREKEELKELVREAHAATKDLRSAMKEVREMVDRRMDERILNYLKEAVDRELKRFQKETSRAIIVAEEGINKRLDLIVGNDGSPNDLIRIIIDGVVEAIKDATGMEKVKWRRNVSTVNWKRNV